MSEPLTPPNCDLSDFPYMPVDIMRLFNSEFHALTNDAEWRAGVTLWLKSFHQVPAGSIPADDIALTRLAELGRDTRSWKKVRAAALRGWITCSDGRLYHPVVCEKVLEAWIGKLSQRLLGGAGNAKRWGTPFDEEPAIVSEIMECRRLLSALNPQSHMLKKRPPKSSAPDSLGHPAGSPASIPPGLPEHIPQGSQERGILRGNGIDIKPNLTASADVITPNSASAAPAASALPGRFEIEFSWQPGAEFATQLRFAGVPSDYPWDEDLPEFVLYRRAAGEKFNQGIWEKKFIDQIKRNQAKRLQAGNEPTRIARSWSPTPQCVAGLVSFGIPRQFVDDCVLGFVEFWIETEIAQPSWNSKFIDRVRNRWATAPKPIETGSAFDRLQDRSWAAGLELSDESSPDDDTPRLSAGGDA